MKMQLKLGATALGLLSQWSAQAQELATKVAEAASTCASCPGPIVDGRPPIIVWFAGGVVVGVALTLAVQALMSKGANEGAQ
jgi:hypothetical protein